MQRTVQTKLFCNEFEMVNHPPGQNEQSARKPNELVIKEQIYEERSRFLSKLAENIYHQLINRKRKKPDNINHINAEFYPYSGLKITLRQRGKSLFLRVSDILLDAPADVLEAALCSIISKILHLKVQDKYREIYRDYIYSNRIRQRKQQTRRVRASKYIVDPAGVVFDLNEVFKNVNKTYFQDKLEKPTLSWSKNHSRSRLGHYDPDLNILVISKKLDKKQIPKMVIDFIMYHELLHSVHPCKYLNGKWTVHTKEFKEAEAEFKGLKTVKKWMRNNKY